MQDFQPKGSRPNLQKYGHGILDPGGDILCMLYAKAVRLLP